MNSKLMVYGAVVVVLLVGAGVWQVNREQERPQEISQERPYVVGVDPVSRDLGTVIYGEVARTEFTLTNSTSQLLKITRVSTSCGCTKAEVALEELQPYESTVVKVSFDPAVHKDDTDLGELTREIYIDTDNPDFPQITMQIEAKVVKEG